jgi:hypothetical protein
MITVILRAPSMRKYHAKNNYHEHERRRAWRWAQVAAELGAAGEFPPPSPGERAGLQGYGHYHEEYARSGGRWLISRSRLERLRTDPLPALPVGGSPDG